MVEHPNFGTSFLEISIDRRNDKAACYKNKVKFGSYGASGNTWDEVRETMRATLIKEGHLRVS